MAAQCPASRAPSERSMPLYRATLVFAGHDAASRAKAVTADAPALLDLKDGLVPSWRLLRLSLNTRAVVAGHARFERRTRHRTFRWGRRALVAAWSRGSWGSTRYHIAARWRETAAPAELVSSGCIVRGTEERSKRWELA
ncbi:hypothetical protein ACP70R_006261 [Stipagrostis hirtigluma subsp. patula]